MASFENTVMFWFAAMSLQVLAAALALRFRPRARGGWLPWAAFCLALVLMVPMRWRPLELALATGLYDFDAALLALVVSVLLVFALAGMRFWKSPEVRDAPDVQNKI